MKKKILNFLTVVTVLLSATPMVAHATENNGTLTFDDIALEIKVPEKYNFLFDAENSYREDVSSYGAKAEDIYDEIAQNNCYFEAMYIEDNSYFVTSYCQYNESTGINLPIQGDMKNYSEDEIKDFETSLTISLGGSSLTGTTFKYRDIYYTEEGEPYIEYEVKGTSEIGDYRGAALYTIVNDHYYAFFSNAFNVDADYDAIFASTESLVDGVTYLERGEAPSDSENTIDPETADDISNAIETLENGRESFEDRYDYSYSIQGEEKHQINWYRVVGYSFIVVLFLIIIITAVVIRKRKEKKEYDAFLKRREEWEKNNE